MNANSVKIRVLTAALLLAIVGVGAPLTGATVNAQGDRLRFSPIQHTKGKCLDYNGDVVIVSKCDGSREQMWALDRYGQLIHAYGWCLSIIGAQVNGAPIKLQSCDGSNLDFVHLSPRSHSRATISRGEIK